MTKKEYYFEYDSSLHKALTSKSDVARWQLHIKLLSIASVCDCTGISHRVAATTASATLQNLCVIFNEDQSLVIDRMKIRREQSKNRKKVIEKSQCRITGNKDLFLMAGKEKQLYKRKMELNTTKKYRGTHFTSGGA